MKQINVSALSKEQREILKKKLKLIRVRLSGYIPADKKLKKQLSI